MIAEFNSYMSNIDIDFFKELCLKHGELRHYKKNEFILHEGDACSFFGFILSGVVKYSCTNRTENKPYNVGFSFSNEFIAVDTNWKVRRILIEKSSIHNWLQNYYKFKIFIYLVSFFVFP